MIQLKKQREVEEILFIVPMIIVWYKVTILNYIDKS